MKLKAAVAENTPKELVRSFNDLRREVLDLVVGPCLHRPNFGPAEFYVQRCDEAVSDELFCEVRLTGVSRTEDRSEEDFQKALANLVEIYETLIHQNLPRGQMMQLMVTIMVDEPPMLYETTKWVGSQLDTLVAIQEREAEH